MSEWRFVYNTSLPEEADELATIERVLRAIASSRDRIYRRNEGRNTVVTYVRNVFPQEAVRGTFRPSAPQESVEVFQDTQLANGNGDVFPTSRAQWILEALRQPGRGPTVRDALSSVPEARIPLLSEVRPPNTWVDWATLNEDIRANMPEGWAFVPKDSDASPLSPPTPTKNRFDIIDED
jgi:hypothetical protein